MLRKHGRFFRNIGVAAVQPLPLMHVGPVPLGCQQGKDNIIGIVGKSRPVLPAAHDLAAVKGKLHVPVVWNSGGYERPETLERLRGLVDIYMPDFKYISSELSLRYSGVRDYAERTAEAIAFMYKMLGRAEFDEGGLMRRGVLVRHLVLPACRRDSEAVLRRLAEIVPPADVVLGLMSQYTPSFYSGEEKNLRRRVTTFEYESVRKVALELGFEGYMQSPMSATAEFTPKFTNDLKIEL